MKILFRNSIIWNQVLFLLFTFLLLHLSRSLIIEVSPFDISELKSSVFLYKFPIVLILVSSLLILKLNRFSKYIYLFTLIGFSFILIFLLINNFSKIILVLLFFYAVSAYYNYQLFKEEITESYYNPNYDLKSLFDPMLVQMTCEVKCADTFFRGHLSNWNENGCFIFLETQQALKGRCEVSLELDNKVFKNNGFIVSQTSNNDGIGIKFFENRNSIYNWDNFYKIILEKGFSAELVK